jgi:glycosyltransferase involved in cell wall biosynthesis
VIVHTDSGGPLEFVIDGENGFICEPDAKTIAERMDLLYKDKIMAQKLGESGFESLKLKNMNWDYVIDKLLN